MEAQTVPQPNGLHRRNVIIIIRIHEAKRLALIQCNHTISDSAINSKARLVRILEIFNLNVFSAILRRKILYASRILLISFIFTLLTSLIREIKIYFIERDKKNKNDIRDLKSRRRSKLIT